MILNLFVRNNGGSYLGIKPDAAPLKDTVLIRPGDSRELIYPDEEIASLVTRTLTSDEVDEIQALHFPPPDDGDEATPPFAPFTLAVLSFTQANPTVAEVSTGDAAKLKVGDHLVLNQTDGVAGSIEDNSPADVIEINEGLVTISLDLSVDDVEGLKGTAHVTRALSTAQASLPAPIAIQLVAFTKESPTVATVSPGWDVSKVAVGQTLKNFVQTSGVEDTIAPDATAVVAEINGRDLTLELDLSAADVTDLVATAEIE